MTAAAAAQGPVCDYPAASTVAESLDLETRISQSRVAAAGEARPSIGCHIACVLAIQDFVTAVSHPSIRPIWSGWIVRL